MNLSRGSIILISRGLRGGSYFSSRNKLRLFKANQLIRDLPCDSCETCQESTGRGLQQLVKRENYCPGVVVFIQFLGISSRFDSFSQLQLSSFQNPLSSLHIAWFIAITSYQLMDYDKPQYIDGSLIPQLLINHHLSMISHILDAFAFLNPL
jgi:hypothetical protein